MNSSDINAKNSGTEVYGSRRSKTSTRNESDCTDLPKFHFYASR